MSLFPYAWKLQDGYPSKNIKKHGCKVFGTFICGGGSSMGYKLAGFNHLGGVEIDQTVADIYQENHSPKYLYVDDIRRFNAREDLPEELYDLDILDGSPPCSSFSMAGNRDNDWGKKKQFSEGQTKQRLDDLVFVYIDTIKKLQPKVALLENVKGLIQGNAKAYAKNMKKQFEAAGYRVQVFLLNAGSMGVPQKRERVFFIGLRNDFDCPNLKLEFDDKQILFKEIDNGSLGKKLTGDILKYWALCPPGNSLSKVHPKGNYFGCFKIGPNCTSNTLIASAASPIVHPSKPHQLSDDSYCKIGSYPLDYNFKKINPQYLIGMSVPPVMTAQISNQIYNQWLKPIGDV